MLMPSELLPMELGAATLSLGAGVSPARFPCIRDVEDSFIMLEERFIPTVPWVRVPAFFPISLSSRVLLLAF